MILTVAGCIFFAGHQGLGVEETPVYATPNLIDDVRFEIDVEGARNVFARRGLREEGTETVVVGRVIDETTVGLDRGDQTLLGPQSDDTHAQTMLDSVELPWIEKRLTISVDSETIGSKQNRTKKRVVLACPGGRAVSVTPQLKDLQQAFPIWTPACPTCTEITSRIMFCGGTYRGRGVT